MSPPIRIRGARTHNLRNIHLEIPRGRLTVITGPSGSGKSSLAFDTLYAEGQRRYILSLSAYARQFLDQLDKPDVDAIEGLCPAIAIEQRTATANPRSTVATITEIHDFLRLLFAHTGIPHHPVTGRPLLRLTSQDILEKILAEPAGSRFLLLSPVRRDETASLKNDLDRLRRQGFTRIRLDGAIHTLDDPAVAARSSAKKLEVVIDRLTTDPAQRTRLADSLELALHTGNQTVIIHWPDHPERADWKLGTGALDPETGLPIPQLTPAHFSFNHPLGACPTCQGTGTVLLPDATLIVPDPSLSLETGAIAPWHKAPKNLRGVYNILLRDLARHARVPLDRPWSQLPPEAHDLFLRGSGDQPVSLTVIKNGQPLVESRPFQGILHLIQESYQNATSPIARQRLRRYFSPQTCPDCGGARLRPESLAVRLPAAEGQAGLNIHEFCALPVADALHLIRHTPWPEQTRSAFQDLFHEIESRLTFLCRVGLPYLALNREAGTLSGGETQRIRLASQIGTGLSGVLYVLDEPSIGLHPRDNARLLESLHHLRDLDNTLVVVEHDEDTIRQADHVIEFGPGAGRQGGQIIATGTPAELEQHPHSLTGPYLSGARPLAVTPGRQKPSRGWITITGVSAHNLKEVDVRVPIGCLTCVTGVSGSGKSTLVHDVLALAVRRHLGQSTEPPGSYRTMDGLDAIDQCVLIDQTPIGRSPRSNPATYLGFFDPIRQLFAQLPVSRARGYSKARFSFNTPGGRCERCQGEGSVRIEMQLLPEVRITCPACHGKRFNRETLEITYKNHTIADVLSLTVEEARHLFQSIPAITRPLDILQKVGLGYLTLGQSATTLSGGEAQRLKLAAELARPSTGRSLYILDEPTTGLHFADIEILLSVLFNLRDSGNTILIIEHQLDVIKNADYVIDLGPEGGAQGGRVVCAGTPEEIAACPASHTGRYLAPKLAALPPLPPREGYLF